MRVCRFRSEKWQMKDAKVTTITRDSIRKSHYETYHWRSSVTPEKLGVVAVKPESLAIQGIAEYINYLKFNEQDASRYELAFWRKVFQPVSVMVMLLTALSFFWAIAKCHNGSQSINGYFNRLWILYCE